MTTLFKRVCIAAVGIGLSAFAATAMEQNAAAPKNMAPAMWSKIAPQMQAARYAFTADENGAFKAENPAHGFEIVADTAGVRVKDGVVLRAVKAGAAGGADRALPQDVKPTAQGARLEYGRGSVTEWFVNRESGLEQGFTILRELSDLSYPSDLQLLVDVAGARSVTVNAGGLSARITDAQGRDFGYGGLKAWDATGRALACRLESASSSLPTAYNPQPTASLRIVCDTQKAVYPITIDPVLTSMEKKLAALDGAPTNYFGGAVSVDGDVAVVGARRADVGGLIWAGAAYIFERNAGGTNAWGQVAKLTASDSAALIQFGNAVSVADDVVVVGSTEADVGSITAAGAAYVFERNAGGTNAWGEVAKLTASDAAANDDFGKSVCVAGDVIIAGAYGADPGSMVNAGAAYVFERNAGGTNAWGQVQKLTAFDGADSDVFGESVSVAGDVAVVGSSGTDLDVVTDAGAVYIFERNAGGTNAWGFVQKVTATDGVTQDYFGCSVSVAGDVALIGAYGYPNHFLQGSAYIFERSADGANGWVQVKKLTASDGIANDLFGFEVSVADDVAVIGAWRADPGGLNRAGAAYVFARNAEGTNAWGQVQKLTASDAAPEEDFGIAVSVADGTILVGAESKNVLRGAAYLIPFKYDEWNQKNKLTASDGVALDDFGLSVCVAGDVAIVGADASPAGAYQGAAYVYERNAGGTNAWGQVVKLTASDGVAARNFGESVSVAGDIALVGADGDYANRGSVYVFERNAGGTNAWGQVTKLTASDSVAGDLFGYAVSVAGDIALVGARGYPANTYIGAAYVFERNAGGTNAWGEVKKLTAPDGEAGYEFGYSVSVAGDMALVGEYWSTQGGLVGAGAAYIFERNAGGTNTWEQVAKLTASDGEEYDCFGNAVSVAGDIALVGVNQANPSGVTNAGAAYLFGRNVNGINAWGQMRKLAASDGAENDEFGVAVSVAGDVAAVGACDADPGGLSGAGASYIFERNAGGTNAWGQVKKLTAFDGASEYNFGSSVSVAGDVALVGSSGYNVQQGAAYVFEGLLSSNAPAPTSPELVVLGTNGTVIASGDPASAAKGTDFGSFTIGAAAVTNTFVVTNSGTAALTIGGWTTNGTGANAFSIAGIPATVAPGAIGNFTMAFNPSVIGTHTASVSIANNSVNSPYVVYVQGTATKLDQTITSFTPANGASFLVTEPVGLAATASSSLQVSFTNTAGSPASWLNATTITFTATGTVGIVASQVGDATYSAAPDVTHTFNILPVPVTLPAPTGVSATRGAYTNMVQVTWDGAPGATSYDLYRSQANDPSGATLIANIPEAPSPRHCDDYAISPILSYYYWARAKTATLLSPMSYVAMGYAALDPGQATGTADIAVRDLVYLPVNVTNLSPAGTVSCRLQNYGPGALAASAIQFDLYMASTAPQPTAPAINTVWIGGFQRTVNLAVNQEALVVLTAAERQGLIIRGDLLGTYRPEVTVRHLSSINDPVLTNNTAPGVGLVTVKTNGPNSIGRAFNDYDGDGRADCAVLQVAQGGWSVVLSGMRFTQVRGQETSLSNWQGAPGDYDGDGLTDVGLYNPTSGYWWVSLSSTHQIVGAKCGDPGFAPAPADFDGDGKTDPLAYRNTDGFWVGMGSANGYAYYGAWWYGAAPQAVPADYDGDRLADLMDYAESTGMWFGGLSSGGYQLMSGGYGGPGFMAVPADYDGDGRADFGLYAYATGWWYVLESNRSTGPIGQGYREVSYQLGAPNGIPVTADYDGDGLADPAVYHTDGLWEIYLSSQGYALFSGGYGGPGYYPVTE
ncbi:MAG: choice-of-anchor D domain-containing protein [Kiritimatiellae bacterium]|nr:choice-of-anchor D domain-containing protein [Kiritimatiellia bacterium]